jgi:penicillin-binding protein 1A
VPGRTHDDSDPLRARALLTPSANQGTTGANKRPIGRAWRHAGRPLRPYRCKVRPVWWQPPDTSPPFSRVEVVNPSDGGFLRWLIKFYAFGAFCAVGLVLMVGAFTYAYFSARIPPLPNIDRYTHETAESTVLRAWDGTTLADWATERREIVSAKDVPPLMVQAFVAIEDRRFFEHGGLDYRGIARAALANLRAGGVSQGGSTITQQVARSFFDRDLFFARSLFRKIPEAILARRLEARYTKDEILTLYLNQIFLGQTAYGVAAAARRYFDKTVGELNLSEMATIAGIANAPSRFSPIPNVDRSKRRRDQVLSAMATAGVITAEEATVWKGKPLILRPPPDFFRERSPYFAEHVRRDIARRYGDKMLWEGGLEIETTLLPWVDAAGQDNVSFSLRKLDKRQGWRGPVAHVTGAAADQFRARMAERYGSAPPAENRFYLGLVESAGSDAQVRVGTQIYTLPSMHMKWAVPFSMKDSNNGKLLDSTAGVLHKGDVIWVSNTHKSSRKRFSDWTYDPKNEVIWSPPYEGKAPPPGPPTVKLEQTPRVQGSLFSYDHETGYVVAMVGGEDFDRSEFNRVVQACRQPGSTYKPIYYSLALDKGYGYDSLLNDIPKAEVDPITGEVWIPTNFSNTIEFQVTLEYSLVWSKNVPSVQLFKLLGGGEVENWARRLGFTTQIIPDKALALGASCVRMEELTRAFSAFARNGSLTDPVYVRRVRDRHGVIMEDNTAPSDPMGSPSARLDRLVTIAGKRPKEVIPPRTAWLMSKLLRRVVTDGHNPALRNTGIKAAGKTGTSSATMDTWFVGFTSRWMTTTWLGDDKRERPLGHKDAAFMLAVPMFSRYLWDVAQDQNLLDIPWAIPPGVKPSDTGGRLRTTMEEVKDDPIIRKKS